MQRRRVIDSLRRVDPISQTLRRSVRIHRRQYSVPGPNALWYEHMHQAYVPTCVCVCVGGGGGGGGGD